MSEIVMSEVQRDEPKPRKSRKAAPPAPAFFCTKRNAAGDWEVVDCEGEIVPGKRAVVIDGRVEVEDTD
jgi:hypothetical protein